MIALGYGVYLAAFVAVFFWTRAYTWTESDALPAAGKKPGFGEQITLIKACHGLFQHGGPRVLAVTCALCLIARLSVPTLSYADVAVVFGVFAFWPFQEWMIHAWLEHIKPFRFANRDIELVITKTHRAHHRNPWNPKYGLTTTYFVVAFLGGVPMLWSFSYVTGVLPLAAVLSGNLLTFLLILNYEWIHYLIHTSYVPRSRFYRRLWRNHRLHHFQNENYWYGLTMLSGDLVLGTQPRQAHATHSQTVLNLGVETAASE